MWDPIQRHGAVPPLGKLPHLTYTGDGYNIGNLLSSQDGGGVSTIPVGGGGGTRYRVKGSKGWDVHSGPRGDSVCVSCPSLNSSDRLRYYNKQQKQIALGLAEQRVNLNSFDLSNI